MMKDGWLPEYNQVTSSTAVIMPDVVSWVE